MTADTTTDRGPFLRRPIKRAALSILLATGLFMQPWAMAATEAPAQEPPTELDEIMVRGNQLWQIRQAIADTEKRFYARFNELNADRDFHMICTRSAPLGTRIQSTNCLPAFLRNAMAEEAITVVNQITSVGELIAAGGYAEVIWLERFTEYRQNALKVINGDRELRALLRQRERLAEQLDERRKEIFKDRWIAW